MKGIQTSEMKYQKTLEMKHSSFGKNSEMKCALTGKVHLFLDIGLTLNIPSKNDKLIYDFSALKFLQILADVC